MSNVDIKITNQMNKEIYTFKPKSGSFDPLELCTCEYKKIERFWANEDKSEYPFWDYTNEMVEQLGGIVKRKDSMQAAMKGLNIIMELSNVHFTKKLDLQYIPTFCDTEDKIRTLQNYMHHLSDKEYWEQLSYSYTLQDFNSVPYIFLKNMFSMDRQDKMYLMDEEERILLEQLPDTVTI